MNLWLSPQGIWYYRKVTVLPCGRRKDIKKSLRTRDSAPLSPIHSSLITGGFIDFVQERAGGRLFPELPHRQDGYSHLWGQLLVVIAR